MNQLLTLLLITVITLTSSKFYQYSVRSGFFPALIRYSRMKFCKINAVFESTAFCVEKLINLSHFCKEVMTLSSCNLLMRFFCFRKKCKIMKSFFAKYLVRNYYLTNYIYQICCRINV